MEDTRISDLAKAIMEATAVKEVIDADGNRMSVGSNRLHLSVTDDVDIVFDKVSFDNPKNAVAHFHGKAFDTSLKEIERDFDSYMAIIKSVPSPMRFIKMRRENSPIFSG